MDGNRTLNETFIESSRRHKENYENNCFKKGAHLIIRIPTPRRHPPTTPATFPRSTHLSRNGSFARTRTKCSCLTRTCTILPRLTHLTRHRSLAHTPTRTSPRRLVHRTRRVIWILAVFLERNGRFHKAHALLPLVLAKHLLDG